MQQVNGFEDVEKLCVLKRAHFYLIFIVLLLLCYLCYVFSKMYIANDANPARQPNPLQSTDLWLSN